MRENDSDRLLDSHKFLIIFFIIKLLVKKYIIIVILLCFALNVKSQTKIVKLYSPDVDEFISKSRPYLNKDIYYIDKR